MSRLLFLSTGWAFHSRPNKLKVTWLKSVGSLCGRIITGCGCRTWWWTSSFILEVWAEAAALEELDSSEIYWLTSLFKCSTLALDSHNLIACAEKNVMPFSGELSCLCGRAVQEALGSPVLLCLTPLEIPDISFININWGFVKKQSCPSYHAGRHCRDLFCIWFQFMWLCLWQRSSDVCSFSKEMVLYFAKSWCPVLNSGWINGTPAPNIILLPLVLKREILNK